MKYFLFILIGLINTTYVFGQEKDSVDYYQPGFLRYENHIYSKNIKTVVLERLGQQLSDPVISLNGKDQLRLSFDDLSGEVTDYSYRFIHCNSKWESSELNESDFVNGFFTDHIISYRSSFSTLQKYFHYTLDFPNENMQPTISGNYLLVIFNTETPDQPIVTYRFWVVDFKVDITSYIHRSSDIAKRDTHQEIDFKINTGTLKIGNPYQDIKVTIVQNNCWERALTKLTPFTVINEELDYNYDDINSMQGGNEFRNFDLRTTKFLTQFTDRIEQDPNSHLYSIYLKPVVRRSYERYSTEDDINGHYLIKVYDGRDGDLEGDYIQTYFTLPVPEELKGGNLYLYGQLTNWELQPSSRLKYDPEKSIYTANMKLKQGYYNYTFLFVPDSTSIPEIAETEGNHYETENDYQIFVYWKDITSRYDRLIGYRKANSRKN
jgi:hypothetical protein